MTVKAGLEHISKLAKFDFTGNNLVVRSGCPLHYKDLLTFWHIFAFLLKPTHITRLFLSFVVVMFFSIIT